jgi:cobalamin-dependent methionine synthase I
MGHIVGRDRTDSNGSWSIQKSLTAGDYEAVVKQARIEGGTTRRSSA